VRTDLLTNVKILDEDAVPAPPGFSPGKYADKVFKMFGGEETEVILEAENTLVKKFIDRFGDSFSIRKASSTSFFATVWVSISPTFFSWVFQYNGRIRIVEPEIVTQEYAGMLGRLLRYYQNFGLGIPEGQEPR
ncbi:MAG: WYL domain-containing protein, partial [Lachnospiraceae bacterium]|nr:WYL domain-containing protein [Lachnospiraceae bacterium]